MLKRNFERKFILEEKGKIIDKEFITYTFDSIKNYKKVFKENCVDVVQGYLTQEIAKHILKDIHLDLKVNVNNFSEYRLRNIQNTYYYTMKTNGIFRNDYEVLIDESLYNKYWSKVFKKLNKKRLSLNMCDCEILIDQYKANKLTLVEVETEDLLVSKEFCTIGKEVTTDCKYFNINLAK